MENRNLLVELCVESLKKKGLYTSEYQKRLMLEMKDIDNQGEHDYFLDLYRRKIRFLKNENNLLVPFVLGLVDDFDISQSPAVFYGEFPDIDQDYISEVQGHLKTIWAPATFGKENVCCIGNYTTFGIKSALIDMARVFGKDRKEVLQLTTVLGLKDDEGKSLSWEKALELFPDLKAYCDANPEVADAAHRLLNRNRGMGMHAGGLIISKSRIDNLVPLVKGKDGVPMSAFVEGLHGTDLSPLGLIKFDVLVVVDLLRVHECCQLIKQRYGLDSICALPGQQDWSDTSYLNDPESLAAANQGKLKCVFQFDSDGIRDLARKGGVTRFEDLVAYTSLFRPGPMTFGLHKTYCDRKKGNESYELHDALKPILGMTYGVAAYQEQILKILNIIGGVPKSHCEKVRKAITKKNEKVFKSYHESFVKHGMKVLGWEDAKTEELWQQIQSWSEYGFNLSHAVAYSYTSARLLWLKTHYPLEFFTVTLRCEGMGDKVKEYKIEVERNGIKLHPVDINRSEWTFGIVDDGIYMGFSNIKGVGEDVAKKVVANQPYASFMEFLQKFGTDASVIKPLIGLSIFKDADRVTLYEFYEHYKAETKKKEDRDKRSVKTRDMLIQSLKNLLCIDGTSEIERICQLAIAMSQAELVAMLWPNGDNDSKIEMTLKCIKKYNRNLESIKKKQEEDRPISFDGFVPTGEIDPTLKAIYTGFPEKAEQMYYGFDWEPTMLEHSPDFEGRTFDAFEDESKLVLCVEVQIVGKPERKVGKKGKGAVYYSIPVQDVKGVQQQVIVWETDYERFKEEFEYWDESRGKGNLLKIRLERPGEIFKTYKFDAPPRHMRDKLVPADKAKDHRLIVMRRPPDGQDGKKKEVVEERNTTSETGAVSSV